MLVEEAGQVLEAHVLGSLVPSVEHLILIGDPQQLRPNLKNYCTLMAAFKQHICHADSSLIALSMDNKRGKQLFKFDMSLMERLATNGLAMSQINVQRRMRPGISTLIRESLYPALQDHELVKSYPDVSGFSKNIYFFSHEHRENEGAEESASKYNTFEVNLHLE
jgi:superfamily I DNA and/or RNA helicase